MSSDDVRRRQDDRLIGELIARVEILTAEVGILRGQVAKLNDRMSSGRGIFYGAMFAAGSVGAGLSHVVEKVLR